MLYLHPDQGIQVFQGGQLVLLAPIATNIIITFVFTALNNTTPARRSL